MIIYFTGTGNSLAAARRLGFSGYTQSRSSQDAAFTPEFTEVLQILL